jgi:hypothetical protein
MANYFSNGTALSTIIRSATDLTFRNNFNSRYTTDISYATTLLKIGSNIDEKQNLTGYQYNGTDISTYTIAYYTEHTANATPSIPSWCTAIRAVLIGAGGAGGTGESAKLNLVTNNYDVYTYDFQERNVFNGYDKIRANYTVPIKFQDENGVIWDLNDLSNYNGQRDIANWKRTLNFNEGGGRQNSVGLKITVHSQYNFTSGSAYGAKGGGGGYIYLPVLSVASTPQVTVGSGSTVLVASGYTLTASGGGAASLTTAGSGGGTDAQVLSVTRDSGKTNGDPGTSANTVVGAYSNYGYGGAGGAPGNSAGGSLKTQTPESGTAGTAGTGGYCRIYYLAKPINAVIPGVGSSLNSPINYLKLETNSTDTGSTPKTITTNGTVTYTTVGFKKCAYFDNNQSNHLSFTFDYATADFTFCFWINVKDSTYYTAVGIGNEARGNTAFHVDVGLVNYYNHYNSDGIYGYVALNTNNPWTVLTGYCCSNSSYIDTWTHVAFSVKQTNSEYYAKQYINGQFISHQNGSGTLGTGCNLTPTTWRIGTSADNARGFYGYIREFCVYNSVLSDAQIQQVYNATM